MNVVIIKLVSGEELFAELVGSSEDTIMLRFPFSIQKTSKEDEGTFKVNLKYERYMNYFEMETYTVSTEHVMFCEPMPENLKQFYSKMLSELDEPIPYTANPSLLLH